MKPQHSVALGALVSEPLHSLLRPGESILHVGTGRLMQRAGLARRGWVITVTDQRVLCTRDERQGRRVVECERSALLNVQSHAGIFGSKVVVVSTGETIVIDGLTRSGASAMAAAIVRHPVPSQPVTGATAPGKSISEDSHEALLDRIDRLESDMEELRAQVRFLEALPLRADRGLAGLTNQL